MPPALLTAGHRTMRSNTGVYQMAKTHEVEAEDELSAKTQHAIDEIRRPFGDYVKGFINLEAKRRDLAPKFMKAANLWQAEVGGTFVEFVRMLHPEIGDTVKEYKAHPAYQAADYLRRVSSQRAMQTVEGGTGQQADRVETPMVVLERVLASLLPKLPEKESDKLFTFIKEQCNWSDQRIETLRNRVSEVDPLVEIRGRTLDNIKLQAVIISGEEATAKRAS